MPFGKYRGFQMSQVPAAYFHWLWNAGKKNDVACPVHEYIKSNMFALQQEHSDGIWDDED